MPLTLDRLPTFGRRTVRLDTLVRLRWLAIAGQTATVLVVAFGLGFPLPMGGCLALIALSAWVNLILRLRFPAIRRFTARATTALLAYDIVQLAGLIYLTGGLQNPFAFLLIAPVMISATALPPQKTAVLGVVVVAVTTVLAFFHEPLPWHPDETLKLPFLYIAGMWMALVSTLIFMSVYAFRVAEEARQLADALTATELVLAREQHLNALDGLAAAAAHELGTPLATIALVVRELERELVAGDPHSDDIHLLASQTERCREILRKLTSLGSDPESPLDRMPVTQLLEEVASPHRDFGVTIRVSAGGKPGAAKAAGKAAKSGGAAPGEPVIARNPAILYGLGNIVENAVDYASGLVEIAAEWSADTLSVTVSDDGQGFGVEIIERLGEPYVTTRGPRSVVAEGEAGDSEAGGLGLGFFIAKTLLERTGAHLSLANRAAPARGAVVTIVWPRAAVDIALAESNPASEARRRIVATASNLRPESL